MSLEEFRNPILDTTFLTPPYPHSGTSGETVPTCQSYLVCFYVPPLLPFADRREKQRFLLRIGRPLFSGILARMSGRSPTGAEISRDTFPGSHGNKGDENNTGRAQGWGKPMGGAHGPVAASQPRAPGWGGTVAFSGASSHAHGPRQAGGSLPAAVSARQGSSAGAQLKAPGRARLFQNASACGRLQHTGVGSAGPSAFGAFGCSLPPSPFSPPGPYEVRCCCGPSLVASSGRGWWAADRGTCPDSRMALLGCGRSNAPGKITASRPQGMACGFRHRAGLGGLLAHRRAAPGFEVEKVATVPRARARPTTPFSQLSLVYRVLPPHP